MIAERELLREARRVLRKLGGEGTVLMRGEDGKYRVHGAGRPVRGFAACAPEMVAAFRTRDWIAPRGTEPESFRLSEAGAAWLKRAEADGDPYAAQHRVMGRSIVIAPDGSEQEVAVNLAESPLARLHARGLVDAVQFAAGERLRRDYTFAQLSPRLGVDLSAAAGFSSGRRSAKDTALFADTVLAAKQRFTRAMKAVGPGLNDLLFELCCALSGLEDAERHFGWPSRAGKVVLCLALDRLALHYGLIVTAPRRAKLRGWRGA
jgi:hypothetical protein